MKLDSLPTNYKPYKEIECAGNRLIDGVAIIAVNDYIPLLIGSGETPEVWISIPANKTGDEWQPLVRKNRSLHKAVSVVAESRKVVIDTPDGVVLEVQTSEPSKATITKLDLRPFGINVFLDKGSLNVLSNYLSGNTVVGAKILIGIGGKKQPNKANSADAKSRAAD